MSSQVPREPSNYHPTDHAVIRKRERNIKWEWVSEALEDGKVHPSCADDCRVFIHPVNGELLYVTANIHTGEIVTVAWYHEGE